MFRISLALSFILFHSSLFAQNIDVQHYKFEIELSDKSDTVKGTAVITVKFLQDTDSIALDFASLKQNGKGMRLIHADYEFDSGMGMSSKIAENKLILRLFPKGTAGAIRPIYVSYKGIPADGLIISKNKYGQRTFFSDNWPNRAHNWLPCVDDPADKASVEFLVTAPAHYQVISNGVKVEETNLGENKKLTHWKEDVPLPTKIMVIGVAEFAVGLAGVVDDHIPVQSWVYPADRDEGFYDYAIAPDILEWFIKRVGPYGYKKLANVQSKTIFGGMENASAIFYSENGIDGKRSSEATVAHEIAHQWFGNMATEKSFAHLWLSEGFATYMTVLYMGSKYRSDTLEHMLREDRQQVIDFSRKSGKPVVDPDTRDYMSMLNANSYQKGSWVLRMLHHLVGDEVFWRGIREYYRQYAGKNADTEDFRKVMETVSGKDLKAFFQRWLYTHGQPQLDWDWDYDEQTSTLMLRIDQKQSKSFRFPLEIALVDSSDRSRFRTIEVSKASQVFEFKNVSRPRQVALDPRVFLLFEDKSPLRGHKRGS